MSFSLTIGSTPELEELGEGLVGVAVVRAPGHVVDGEQHLPGDDVVAGELLGVAVHEQALADRRRRPAGRPGRAGDASARAARRPAAIAPEETSTTSAPRSAAAASTSTSARTRSGSMPAGRGGQRRRADLDDDPPGPGDLRATRSSLLACAGVVLGPVGVARRPDSYDVGP